MAKKVMLLSILLLVLLGLFLYYVFKKSDKKPTPETFYETAPRIEGYGDWEYENEESAYVPH